MHGTPGNASTSSATPALTVRQSRAAIGSGNHTISSAGRAVALHDPSYQSRAGAPRSARTDATLAVPAHPKRATLISSTSSNASAPWRASTSESPGASPQPSATVTPRDRADGARATDRWWVRRRRTMQRRCPARPRSSRPSRRGRRATRTRPRRRREAGHRGGTPSPRPDPRTTRRARRRCDDDGPRAARDRCPRSRRAGARRGPRRRRDRRGARGSPEVGAFELPPPPLRAGNGAFADNAGQAADDPGDAEHEHHAADGLHAGSVSTAPRRRGSRRLRP